MKPGARWLPPVGVGTVIRVGAGMLAAAQVAKAARRTEPLAVASVEAADAAEQVSACTISVVIPARDEASRIVPLLDALRGAQGVTEVIVVDDESSDDTAAVARRCGASVLQGAPVPNGWAGKAWALQQGITAATGEWIVTLDADTRPNSNLAAALVQRAVRDGLDLVTVGGRFDCPTAGARWLHPAMLTTLIYRFGPPGVRTTPGRMLANGQCMAFRRRRFDEVDGFASVAHHVVEDVAFARSVAARGWNVAMLDGTDLLTTRMYEDFADTWRGWGRSLALPGVESPVRQLRDLAMLVLTMVLPLPRLLSGRGDVVDVALVAIRWGTLVGTRPAYKAAGAGYWASPLADGVAVAALGRCIISPDQRWRGRSAPSHGHDRIVRPVRSGGR